MGISQGIDKTKASWRLVVGQTFAPERRRWPNDTFEYRYFSGHHLLQFCVASPSGRDIKAFSKGRMSVGLYREQNVIFFLFRIEGFMDWSDQALSIRLVAEADQGLPPLPDGMRIPLTLVLVDADDGNVAALRMVTYSQHFSRVLQRWLQDQKELPFCKEDHMAAAQDIYRRFPDSKALAKAASFIERAGSKL